MRKIIGFILLVVVAFAFFSSLSEIPFGAAKTKVGKYYIDKGIEQTGAVNIVTSVVLSYRALDTLGEVTVLFIAALGVGAILATVERKIKKEVTSSSLVLSTGCKFLFPFILLFGTYIFLHGHLTPGGGFQGGAIIASGYLLTYLGCPGRRINENRFKAAESLGGLIFVIIGLLGLGLGGYFLFNFLPKGIPNTLLSAGFIPIIYVAVGFKVGCELAGIIDALIEESE
jgi:multicomponent Na+:H+ antiporter subunit B